MALLSLQSTAYIFFNLSPLQCLNQWFTCSRPRLITRCSSITITT